MCTPPKKLMDATSGGLTVIPGSLGGGFGTAKVVGQCPSFNPKCFPL